MREHLTADLERINNKYHMQSEPFNAFARMAYHGWKCDPATGYDDGRMAEELKIYVDSLDDTSHSVIKAKAISFVLDHMRFGFDEHDYFVCLYNWNRPRRNGTYPRNRTVEPDHSGKSPVPVRGGSANRDTDSRDFGKQHG